MRGRLPKPTAIKAIRGHPGHHPKNKAEPKLPEVSPSMQPPPNMDDTARAEWNRLIDTLTTTRVLTQGDVAIFVAYCNYWSEYVRYDDMIKKMGAPFAIIQKKNAKGQDIPGAIYTEWHPARIMRETAYSNWRTAAVELGLTPSSRSRVRQDSSAAKTDTVEAIRARLRA